MSDFLYEGGYAFYVWAAYGASFVALLAAVIWTLAAYGAAKRSLAALQDSETKF